MNISASLGIATFPLHGSDAGMLTRHADMAMYAAKHERSGIAIYSPALEHSPAQLAHKTKLYQANGQAA